MKIVLGVSFYDLAFYFPIVAAVAIAVMLSVTVARVLRRTLAEKRSIDEARAREADLADGEAENEFAEAENEFAEAENELAEAENALSGEENAPTADEDEK